MAPRRKNIFSRRRPRARNTHTTPRSFTKTHTVTSR